MAEKDEFLKLDNQLCFALYSAQRAMNAVYRPMLDDLHLTYPQYLVLLVLWESRQASTVNGLGEKLYLDSGTLTPLLKRMEQNGLIRRQRSRQDERVVEIALTDAGSAMKARVLAWVDKYQCLADVDLGDETRLKEDIQQLNHRLRALARKNLPRK